MANITIAPTKSNLLMVKEQLSVAESGYELLEQKREILVMELMKLGEDVNAEGELCLLLRVVVRVGLKRVDDRGKLVSEEH